MFSDILYIFHKLWGDCNYLVSSQQELLYKQKMVERVGSMFVVIVLPHNLGLGKAENLIGFITAIQIRGRAQNK